MKKYIIKTEKSERICSVSLEFILSLPILNRLLKCLHLHLDFIFILQSDIDCRWHLFCSLAVFYRLSMFQHQISMFDQDGWTLVIIAA